MGKIKTSKVIFKSQAMLNFCSSIRVKIYLILSLSLMFSIFSASCGHKQVSEPKPIGYFRIELPEHQYSALDTTLPFSFEKSIYSTIEILPQKDNSVWINIDYPNLNAAFKFTYFKIKNADSLRRLLISEDKMVKFHYQKAEDVQYSIVRDTTANLLGQTYEIFGKSVATPFQFWLTDSANNFLRASLYFDGAPNNDSLQPVIEYLKEDGMHIINTFSWK